MNAMRKAVRVVIRGRVQGVGYRAWLAREAEARGLDGWVRNRRDGAVEAPIAGPEPDVNEAVAQFRRGPARARVDAVETEAAADPGRGFTVRPTV